MPYTPSATEIGFIVAGGLAIAAMGVGLLAVLARAGHRRFEAIWRDFEAGRAARRAPVAVVRVEAWQWPAREREGRRS